MGTTAEKLYKILDSKEEIKQALIAKGINITDETTFAEYAEKINEITNGGAITDEEALLFIKDLAEGKRKIARAVRNKYEGTKGEASEVTEYSTFDELSNKISQIPIEVPLGSAMEQNGGVLPFYDVYNEALKAMKEFAGYGFNGCCAFELDKWSYDDDHKVTLSGADAYYTSDGTFIKDGIITKNGTQIGELDDALYQFRDTELENTNRFVVLFFTAERYEVPKSLPPTSCLNLWCIKGTPLINFNGDFTMLNSINVYEGELKDTSSLNIKSLTRLQKLYLSHIQELSNNPTDCMYNNTALCKLFIPNVRRIENGSLNLTNSLIRYLNLPNLEYFKAKGSVFYFNNVGFREVEFPKLEEIVADQLGNSCLFYTTPYLSLIKMPSLRKCLNGITLGSTAYKKGCKIELGNPVGGNIRLEHSSNSNLEVVTIKKGFKSTLNLGRLPSLTQQSVHDIIDNLAICEGEDKDKYTITLSSSVMTQEIKDRLQAKGYKQATLG